MTRELRKIIVFFLNTCVAITLVWSIIFLYAAPGAAESSRLISGKTGQLKKVLYVNSYHWGYEWSDAITRSIARVFGAELKSTGEIDNRLKTVALRIHFMDTKRNAAEEYKKKAALKTKSLIDQWQPDVVITSDDNAAKYLIAPYFIDKPTPFVFCGVNWDSSEYGLPSSNVTGMIEVQLIDQLLHTMLPHSKGKRVAFLKGDDLSARKEAEQYEKHFRLNLDKRFVKTFTEWKTQFILLQKQADMILLGNPASIADWNRKKAQEIIDSHTEVPTGNWDAWMASLALVTFATKPQEQGEWAAKTALEILEGKQPSEIPLVRNKTAKVYLNMSLARKMGVKFDIELINRATFTDN